MSKQIKSTEQLIDEYANVIVDDFDYNYINQGDKN